METILLKYYSVVFLFQCIMGVIGVVTFTACLIWLLREIYLTWREKKAKQKDANSRKKLHACRSRLCSSLRKSVANICSTISRTDVFTLFPRSVTLKLAFYAPSDTMPKRNSSIAMPTFG